MNDPINRAKVKAEGGKIKIKRRKLKTDIAQEVSPENSQVLNDNVSRSERKKICKEARKEAHSIVADTKKKLSDEMTKDLGLG